MNKEELDNLLKELKPCPFCGEPAICSDVECSYPWFVICKKCFARTRLYETEKEAIDKWNQRV